MFTEMRFRTDDVLRVEADRIQPPMIGDKDGSLILKFLRDDRHFGLNTSFARMTESRVRKLEKPR
jgi:hypothetical protein